MQISNTSIAPSTPPLQPNDLLNEKEAAATLNCGIATLRNWRSLNKGPRFVKIGKRMVRYRRSELEAFINGETA